MCAAPLLIEEFVEALNDGHLEPLSSEGVPWDLRTDELPGFPGWFLWKIRPVDSTARIRALEGELPHAFPSLYRSLITHYRFAQFEVGPVFFFANTGIEVSHELSRAIFCDKYLSPFLLEHNFLQFGSAAGGWYDPVCFDMKRKAGGDAPIVRLDHEWILIRSRTRVMEEIAPSFEAFLKRVISGEYWW